MADTPAQSTTTTTEKVAISDVGTKLYIESSTANKYEKLISITSAPATGGTPNTIEVTELDSANKQYIPDRQETPAYEFEANYTGKKFKALKEKIGENAKKKYLIGYNDGSGETFEGEGSCWVKEVSAGNAIKIGLSFAVTKHEFVEDTKNLILPVTPTPSA